MPVCDVLRVSHDAERTVFVVPDDRGGKEQPDDPPVGAHASELVGDLARGLREHVADHVEPHRVVGVDVVVAVVLDDLVSLVAEEPAQGPVDVEEAPLEVEHRHRGRGLVAHDPPRNPILVTRQGHRPTVGGLARMSRRFTPVSDLSTSCGKFHDYGGFRPRNTPVFGDLITGVIRYALGRGGAGSV